VFDKTGTLTKGQFTVTSIKSNNISNNKLLFFIGSVEQLSEHPLAQPFLDKCNHFNISLATPIFFNSVPRRGITANIQEFNVLFGNKAFMFHNNIDCNVINIETKNQTVT